MLSGPKSGVLQLRSLPGSCTCDQRMRPFDGSMPLTVPPPNTTSCSRPPMVIMIGGASDVRKSPLFHDHGAVTLTKRHHRLSRSADAADDGVAIRDRAAAVAGLDHGSDQQLVRVELLDEVVRPEHLAGLLVEREELLVGADGEQAIADDQRRRVRPGAEAEVFSPRRVLVFPDRLAGRGIHRDDGLFRIPRTLLGAPVAGAVHREQLALVYQDCGVSGAERARPEHRRTSVRPLFRQPGGVDDGNCDSGRPTGATNPVEPALALNGASTHESTEARAALRGFASRDYATSWRATRMPIQPARRPPANVTPILIKAVPVEPLPISARVS